MNRGEALGLGALCGIAVFIFCLGIWYYLVIDNLIVVAISFGYELESVKENIWWIFIGFSFLKGIAASLKTTKYFRKDKCKHCGKDRE